MLRALHITGLVLLHGILYLARWTWLVASGAPQKKRHELFGQTVLMLFSALGATFIKVAQFLSTRSDLLPPHMVQALSKLQDRVAPFSYQQVRQALQQELGRPPEEIFLELDPYPVASASVAQVHRGRLSDGTVVAVKVLRPRIEQTVEKDLRLIRLAARLLACLPCFRLLSPREVVEEFAIALSQQLDLRLEAENNLRFAKNFADDPAINVPQLLEELCTRRVMCMEYIQGTRLLSGPWNPEQAEALARLGFSMLLKMVFAHGFVHADLHPGNLFVTQGRLFMVDLGLVAELDTDRRQALVQLFVAWAGQNAQRVCEVMLRLLPQGQSPAHPEELHQEVARLMERYRTVVLAEIKVGEVLGELLRLMHRHRLRLEPALTMVLLSIGVVEGVGRQLAPRLDLMAEALAFAREAGLALS